MNSVNLICRSSQRWRQTYTVSIINSGCINIFSPKSMSNYEYPLEWLWKSKLPIVLWRYLSQISNTKLKIPISHGSAYCALFCSDFSPNVIYNLANKHQSTYLCICTFFFSFYRSPCISSGLYYLFVLLLALLASILPDGKLHMHKQSCVSITVKLIKEF